MSYKAFLRFTITIIVVMTLCLSMVPINVFASGYIMEEGESITHSAAYTDEHGTVHTSGMGTTSDGGHFFFWSEDFINSSAAPSVGYSGTGDAWGGNYNYSGGSGNSFKDITAMIVSLCKEFNRSDSDIKNQISFMSGLYSMATLNYVSDLGLADAMLISLLNHEDINSALLSTSYTLGDLNRVIAGRISENAEAYIEVKSIADATGLSAEEIREILRKIAAGEITKETIEKAKNTSKYTNRGPALRIKALKQEKVYTYLLSEVERMTTDENALSVLYDDLGEGYVKNMISGQSLDKYRVVLYKEHLAKVLDEEKENNIVETVTGADTYKVSSKVRSAISNIFKHEVNHAESGLSDELQQFLDEHLKNGVLSEKEAREYLILSKEFKAGQDGLGEAAKQLTNGVKHLQGFKKALDTSGKVFDTLGKVKKADEFIEYWATDYSQQEIMLDDLVDMLAASGADPEMLVAAKELKSEYDSKLTGIFDKVYGELIDKGIGTVKSTFLPIKIVESCISLAGMITGADDKVDALETALAMQGICEEAINSYENAVLNVYKGDESQEAVLRVSSSYAFAKQSLCSYYEAMIELADSEKEKEVFSEELAKLEKMSFATVPITLLTGGAGGR